MLLALLLCIRLNTSEVVDPKAGLHINELTEAGKLTIGFRRHYFPRGPASGVTQILLVVTHVAAERATVSPVLH